MLSRLARQGALTILVSIVLLSFFLNTPPPHVSAQQPTPTIDFKAMCGAVLSRALTLTESGCAQTGRNEACYGYTKVRSNLQPGVDAETNPFAASGDILALHKLATIHTEPLDTVNGTWGMAVLKLQADLPDTNPGQNVTFILFGDTEIQPDSAHTNAFYLSTALGELTCNEIPQNALLVRAPGHVAVSFTINGVEITAASVVVLRAPQGKLEARVLEGHVSVTSMGVTQTLLAGQELTVPMNDDKSPAGPPDAPVSATREVALESSVNLLSTLDPTSDKYKGAVTLSGPIEAMNTKMPSLTVYGKLILLDKVSGWQGLQVGQQVRIVGHTLGYMIQAESLFKGDKRITIGVTPPKASQAQSSQPSKPTGNQNSASGSVNAPTNGNSGGSSGTNAQASNSQPSSNGSGQSGSPPHGSNSSNGGGAGKPAAAAVGDDD